MTMRQQLTQLVPAAALTLVAACADPGAPTEPTTPLSTDPNVPALMREMRGLWIATVANIDWPSRTGLTQAQQRAELIDILDRAVNTGINAVVLHVRPAADALYASTLEPWGVMLTGTQGGDPGHDPLAFAITEAHARGLELHAWINPFRAGNSRDSTRMAPLHVFNSKRDLVRVYGSNLWLDPGEPEAQNHSMNVIRDIVTRYDIDAIHADDYFYPYVENNAGGQPIPFPDDATFSRYGAGMSRADWRRANIDRFVQRMYAEVHAIKPTVKVGISPFGIWRPNNPPGVQGLDAYASIYADSRKWLQEGWVDYLAPQLYWAISAPQQSFPALLDWWLTQNPRGRHVWPGLAAYRVNNGTGSAFTLQEIPNQIQLARDRNARGHLLYNTTWTLKQNSGQLASALAAQSYTERAVMPASPWLDATPPTAPMVTQSASTLTFLPTGTETVRWWIVQARANNQWSVRTQFGTNNTFALTVGTDYVRVYAGDAAMNLSAPTDWRR
jgi:uncharacterized lipoprotein YddW (UPF0748 family)